MTTNVGSGLARITIAAPRRRVDIALPESVIVAELLPGILRAAGDGLADDGQAHGGWVLRRQDTGARIDPTLTLAAQEVHDGQVLHLTSRQSAWPEMDYDDVVDAIATKARNRNRAWSGLTTRRAGISFACGTLLLALILVLLMSGPWFTPGLSLLICSVVLLAVGTALARAAGDAGAGTPIGVMAMIYAFIGGALVLGRNDSMLDFGPNQYLLGCGALTVAALIGYIGIAHLTQYFVAGMAIGLLGLIGAASARIWDLPPYGTAAVLAAIIVTFTPMFPLLSIRLGKLPVPGLPTSTEELLADPPHPPLPRVHATVMRSDELLTGLILGSSIVLTICQVLMVMSGEPSAIVLTIVVALSTLLRARLFPAIVHRMPLLIAGLAGLLALTIMTLDSVDQDIYAYTVPPAVVLAAVALLFLGQYFQRRKPTPYFGRLADIFDVLLMLAVVPTMCVVVGLFGYVRGLYG